MNRGNIQTLLPNILFVILLILGFIWVLFFFKPAPGPELAIKTLDALQNKSIDIIIEMNRQMMSLALLLLAGVGAFVANKYSTGKIESFIARLFLTFSSLFAVFSILFGYFLYDKIVEMLSHGMFNSNSPLISLPQALQLYCLWFSAICFVLFVMAQTTPLRSKISNEPIKNQGVKDEG